jgi:hypothetical protein
MRRLLGDLLTIGAIGLAFLVAILVLGFVLEIGYLMIWSLFN